MIGAHGASVIADTWVAGARGFDGQAALAALVRAGRPGGRRLRHCRRWLAGKSRC
jgi:hypothetical protein